MRSGCTWRDMVNQRRADGTAGDNMANTRVEPFVPTATAHEKKIKGEAETARKHKI